MYILASMEHDNMIKKWVQWWWYWFRTNAKSSEDLVSSPDKMCYFKIVVQYLNIIYRSFVRFVFVQFLYRFLFSFSFVLLEWKTTNLLQRSFPQGIPAFLPNQNIIGFSSEDTNQNIPNQCCWWAGVGRCGCGWVEMVDIGG